VSAERRVQADKLRDLYDAIQGVRCAVEDAALCDSRRMERFSGAMLRSANELSRALSILRAQGSEP
jgi:hypothetical protein